MAAGPISRSRGVLATVSSMAVLGPVGLASKLYAGPGRAWVNGSFGGVVYVMFWCLLASLLFPRAAPWRLCTLVLAVTAGLETLQLYHHPILEQIRGSFLGAALIGTTFVWSDFLYYAVGAALAVAWVRAIRSD